MNQFSVFHFRDNFGFSPTVPAPLNREATWGGEPPGFPGVRKGFQIWHHPDPSSLGGLAKGAIKFKYVPGSHWEASLGELRFACLSHSDHVYFGMSDLVGSLCRVIGATCPVSTCPQLHCHESFLGVGEEVYSNVLRVQSLCGLCLTGF